MFERQRKDFYPESASMSMNVKTFVRWCGLLKLLFRWKGSVYKLVWVDAALFLITYYTLSLSYRFGMSDVTKYHFEQFVLYMSKWQSKSLPLTFLLGFFVSQVLFRWWMMFNNIPFMNTPAFELTGLINTVKNPEVSRRIRINIIRYFNQSWILEIMNISSMVRNRFVPVEIRHLPRVEYMNLILERINEDPVVRKYFDPLFTASEIAAYNRQFERTGVKDKQNFVFEDWYIPLQWSLRIMKRGKELGLIENERDYLALVRMVDRYQEKLHQLSILSSFNLPLVYSQVVIIAVYSYFIMHVISSQFIDSHSTRKHKYGVEYAFDYFMPVFGLMEFIFVMGWTKVAFAVHNPMGTDDEDFPMSDFLNYNLRVSRSITSNNPVHFPEELQEQVNQNLQDENLRKDFEFEFGESMTEKQNTQQFEMCNGYLPKTYQPRQSQV